MKLTDLKTSYKAQQIQFITVNNLGEVLESDNVLFHLELKKTKLSDVHPFFESILETLSNSSHLSFSCVYLNINNLDLICDIEINKINNNLYLIVLTDFSKHYKSFKSLVQARNESSIKSDILEIENKVLQEKEIFKNKFIANFSHEVKTPISSIISFSSILKDTELNKNQKGYLDIISSSALHLNSVISDILDISKIEKGKLEIKLEVFDFSKFIEHLRAKYKLKCDEKSLDFNVVLDPNIPVLLESDKTRIQQIIQNLLDNAVKFTSNGSITLGIKSIYKRANNNTILIQVKDTGAGISEENIKFIFERFNRLKNSKNIEGVGLGLSIVKEIVELLKGDLQVESKLNEGTTFSVKFKAKSIIEQKEKIKKENKDSIKNLFKNKSKKKYSVLLVEDNTNHQISVFKMLAKTKSFYLDIAGNGIDAIKAISKTNYDVVLMDFELPYINGFEVSKTIKNMSDKKKSSTPIILVTSSINNDEFSKEIRPYFFDIIEKPFQEILLVETILKCVK